MKQIHIVPAILLSFVFFACGKNKCEEKIKKDCITTFEYDPVCGCNGKTYGNPGAAACSGIEEYTKGKCPD